MSRLMSPRSPSRHVAVWTALVMGLALLVGCGDKASSAATTGSNEPGAPKEIELLNVSYDPTRELYAAVNDQFAKDWKASHNQSVKINQSHGGSGKQARAVKSSRSEEHTSELQSPDHLVCLLLLEKKKHTEPARSSLCARIHRRG